MELFRRLLDLVGPSNADRPAPDDPDAPSALSGPERLFFAATAFLAALGLGAVWGIAAGSHDAHLAVDNVGKVPVLLVASSLVSLPVALLVFRLTARQGRVTDLLMAHALGLFAGCLALALLSPLVALYQYTSSFAGMPVAVGSGVLGALVALLVVVRVIRKLSPGLAGRVYGAPIALVLVLQAAALAQLASVTTPVFPPAPRWGRAWTDS
ncbi:MAG: hypothetical protein U0235_11380 [Polyangiaceae bacterium]